MKNLAILLMCLCWLGANATSWRVNNNPAINADFSTFQEAHDAASTGDTIYVEGTGFDNHYGEVVISKKLIVIGPGYFLLDNDSTQANHIVARFQGITINPGAEGTEIYGLQLHWGGSGYRGIVINASNITIARNYFSDDRSKIYFGNYAINNIAILQNFAWEISAVINYTGTAHNILIANNFIRASISNVASGVIVNNVIRYSISASYSQIKNNILYGSSGEYPLAGSYTSTENYVAYNLVSGSLGAYPPSPYGPGNVANVDMTTVFVNFPGTSNPGVDNNWLLNPTGPAAGAGENGIDCGIFGGVTPYVLSGLAPIPRIYEADVPISGSAATGLPVTIKVKSQN
jgi:hypothetical protein